ncbi:DUF4255 domain-containing protein [Pyxidicoccus xibeiensis]|uniref:DUF4255 domain-containing protein n=1 Tax=Pyxidicoccus xibeiensis TaxID=2906759 RepID=UPI0020A73A84|nr:Pvc16 family protein [Pyxidicoccus xibeiensis]MCP3143401.1 DUF4255 domain-containing protein [Pyxidicoccus xibeiensis]
MADFTAIADVSQTLVDLLTEGLSNLGTKVRLDDLQAAPATANLLTMFLFQIREDGHTRNRPADVRTTGTKATLQRPPLALAVHYMLTPWATKQEDNQRILGQAMQSLHDNAIVTGPALRGSLNAGNEALHLAMVPVNLEDQFRVWNSLTRPYRLSLFYEVRVVRIASRVEQQRSTVRSRGVGSLQPRPEVDA